MQIGIGLPGTVPGVEAQLLLDWARRADAGPFPVWEALIVWSIPTMIA